MARESAQPRSVRATALVAGMVLLVVASFAWSTRPSGDMAPLALVAPVLGFLALRLAALAAEARVPDPVWREAMRTMLLGSGWAYLVGGVLASPLLLGAASAGLSAAAVVMVAAGVRAHRALRRSGYPALMPLFVLGATAGFGLLLGLALHAVLPGDAFALAFASAVGVAHLVALFAATPRTRGAPESPVAAWRVPAGVLVGVPLGLYLVYRFTLASRVPYGPIIEWWVIALGFAVLMAALAKHLGVAPTAASLPPTPHRLHQQHIAALPSAEARRFHGLVEGYVLGGRGGSELAQRIAALADAHGVPEAQARRAARDIEDHAPRRGEWWGLTAAGRRVMAQNRARRLALVERGEALLSERLRIAPKARPRVPTPFLDESGRPLVRA